MRQVLISLLPGDNDKRFKNSDLTQFGMAAVGGDLDTVKFLYDVFGDKILDQGKDNKTALYFAVNQGKENVVEFLMAKGANKNILPPANPNKRRYYGQPELPTTPLTNMALFKGHPLTFQALVTKAVDPNSPNKRVIDSEALKQAMEEGPSALQVALYMGDKVTVDFLLAQGIQLNVKMKNRPKEDSGLVPNIWPWYDSNTDYAGFFVNVFKFHMQWNLKIGITKNTKLAVGLFSLAPTLLAAFSKANISLPVGARDDIIRELKEFLEKPVEQAPSQERGVSKQELENREARKLLLQNAKNAAQELLEDLLKRGKEKLNSAQMEIYNKREKNGELLRLNSPEQGFSCALDNSGVSNLIEVLKEEDVKKTLKTLEIFGLEANREKIDKLLGQLATLENLEVLIISGDGVNYKDTYHREGDFKEFWDNLSRKTFNKLKALCISGYTKPSGGYSSSFEPSITGLWDLSWRTKAINFPSLRHVVVTGCPEQNNVLTGYYYKGLTTPLASKAQKNLPEALSQFREEVKRLSQYDQPKELFPAPRDILIQKPETLSDLMAHFVGKDLSKVESISIEFSNGKSEQQELMLRAMHEIFKNPDNNIKKIDIGNIRNSWGLMSGKDGAMIIFSRMPALETLTLHFSGSGITSSCFSELSPGFYKLRNICICGISSHSHLIDVEKAIKNSVLSGNLKNIKIFEEDSKYESSNANTSYSNPNYDYNCYFDGEIKRGHFSLTDIKKIQAEARSHCQKEIVRPSVAEKPEVGLSTKDQEESGSLTKDCTSKGVFKDPAPVAEKPGVGLSTRDQEEWGSIMKDYTSKGVFKDLAPVAEKPGVGLSTKDQEEWASIMKDYTSKGVFKGPAPVAENPDVGLSTEDKVELTDYVNQCVSKGYFPYPGSVSDLGAKKLNSTQKDVCQTPVTEGNSQPPLKRTFAQSQGTGTLPEVSKITPVQEVKVPMPLPSKVETPPAEEEEDEYFDSKIKMGKPFSKLNAIKFGFDHYSGNSLKVSEDELVKSIGSIEKNGGTELNFSYYSEDHREGMGWINCDPLLTSLYHALPKTGMADKMTAFRLIGLGNFTFHSYFGYILKSLSNNKVLEELYVDYQWNDCLSDPLKNFITDNVDNLSNLTSLVILTPTAVPNQSLAYFMEIGINIKRLKEQGKLEKLKLLVIGEKHKHDSYYINLLTNKRVAGEQFMVDRGS